MLKFPSFIVKNFPFVTCTRWSPHGINLRLISCRRSLYKVQSCGDKGSLSYKVYICKTSDDSIISPWHDIPIDLNINKSEVSFVNEIPANSTAKFEVSKSVAYNPIMQDSKNGKPRHYGIPINWNYGMIPQTWEDPSLLVDGFGGDNDPIDAVEIGAGSLPSGSVLRVKILGSLCLIDNDEIDWKVICIRTTDASKFTVDVSSIVNSIKEWFRTYKVYEGKKVNAFGYDEKILDSDFTKETIMKAHDRYKLLFKSNNNVKFWIPK